MRGSLDAASWLAIGLILGAVAIAGAVRSAWQRRQQVLRTRRAANLARVERRLALLQCQGVLNAEQARAVLEYARALAAR